MEFPPTLTLRAPERLPERNDVELRRSAGKCGYGRVACPDARILNEQDTRLVIRQVPLETCDSRCLSCGPYLDLATLV